MVFSWKGASQKQPMVRIRVLGISSTCAQSLSHVRVWLFATPWTVAHQAPLSIEFSRQEYRIGLPFPTPKYIPDPGIKPLSPESPELAGGFFTTVPPGKSLDRVYFHTEWFCFCYVIWFGLWPVRRLRRDLNLPDGSLLLVTDRRIFLG